jgi:hypothetical protein
MKQNNYLGNEIKEEQNFFHSAGRGRPFSAKKKRAALPGPAL